MKRTKKTDLQKAFEQKRKKERPHGLRRALLVLFRKHAPTYGHASPEAREIFRAAFDTVTFFTIQ